MPCTPDLPYKIARTLQRVSSSSQPAFVPTRAAKSLTALRISNIRLNVAQCDQSPPEIHRTPHRFSLATSVVTLRTVRSCGLTHKVKVRPHKLKVGTP